MDAPVIIAIIVLVILAAVVLAAAAGRRESGKAVGRLSSETVARDSRRRGEAEPAGAETPPGTGKDLERAAVLERLGAELEPALERPPELFVPPDPHVLGVTRRQYLNRSIVGLFTVSLASFGAASLAFAWPTAGGGFGSKIRVGKVSDLKTEIQANKGFVYKAEGRMWIVEYPADALPKARTSYGAPELTGMEAGLLALFQKCPHLGCRVPACPTSQWFECPCHGSQYNRVGEKKGGPAPRGMDRFVMEVTSDGTLIVDTGQVINGPPIGTNTTGQEAEGPHCIGAVGGEH